MRLNDKATEPQVTVQSDWTQIQPQLICDLPFSTPPPAGVICHAHKFLLIHAVSLSHILQEKKKHLKNVQLDHLKGQTSNPKSDHKA